MNCPPLTFAGFLLFTKSRKFNFFSNLLKLRPIFLSAFCLGLILSIPSVFSMKAAFAEGNENGEPRFSVGNTYLTKEHHTSEATAVGSGVGTDFAAENRELNSAQDVFGKNVLFLEISWLKKKVPREALLVVPENKVPMILVRVLRTEDKLSQLWAARAEFSSEDDETAEIQVECFDPKLLFGKKQTGEEMNEVPELIVIQGMKGAVDLNGELAPCLVLPVMKENEVAILGKYLVPMGEEETK